MSHIIGILSCQKYQDKQNAVRETWMQDVKPPHKAVFIVGKDFGETELIGDTLFVNCPDDYPHLTRKMYLFWQWCLTHGDKYHSVFKCDDDTYVRVDRMLYMGKGSFMGFVMKSKSKRHRFASGGAGYRIRIGLLPKILPRYQKNPETGEIPPGPEDRFFSTAAISVGIHLRHNKRLRWRDASWPTPTNGLITSHWIKPNKMKEIHAQFQEINEPI